MIIWRAEITPNFSGSKICHARLPEGSQLLSAGFWKGAISVWAEVNPEAPLMDIPILVIPTGMGHSGDGSERCDRFLGRVEVKGDLIFHLFTVKAEREN